MLNNTENNDDIINLKFKFGNIFLKKKITILDAEVDSNSRLVVLGFYNWGSKFINILLFKNSVDPKKFAASNFFKNKIVRGNEIWAYYSDFEKNLFGLKDEFKIKNLQPSPFVAKEKYISLGSLTKRSGRYLPPFSKQTISQYVFHNLSCLIKEIILMMGFMGDDEGFLFFSKHDFQNRFKKALSEYFKNKW